MQIALDHFRGSLRRVRDFDGLYANLTAQTGGALDLSDMLRGEIVFAVSAFDHYVHEATRLGMLEALQGRRVQTDAFLRFQAPLHHVVRGLQNPASSGWLEDAVREAHGWRSFQLPDKVAEAIRLVSDVALWDELARQRGVSTKRLKTDISAIVDRRNRIVHEADLDPSFPGTRWPINHADTRSAVDLVQWVVESIHLLIV
jgi:hypothetical protein